MKKYLAILLTMTIIMGGMTMFSTSSYANDTYIPTRADADTALEAFLEQFATKTNTRIDLDVSPYSRSRSFWTDAEVLEILVDYYEHTGDKKYFGYIDRFFKAYEAKHGTYTSWHTNPFNDDLMWITIGCARIYMLTGIEKYKTIATYTFDNTFARAWTPSLGGGLLWKQGETGKMSCIQYPATIAACLMYEIHGGDVKIPFTDYSKGGTGVASEKSYLEIAQEIYKWAYVRLRDSSHTSGTYGKIFDSYHDGAVSNFWDGTYNYGTFVGSAVMLYQHTGTRTYLRDAHISATFSMNRKYSKGVINDEYNGNDLPGFKGILARWYGYFIREIDDNEFKTTDLRNWLWQNASTAWNNRNSKNIIWTRWGTKTADDMQNVVVDSDYNYYSSWGCSSALSLLINIPEYVAPTPTDTISSKDGKATIKTEGNSLTADAKLTVTESFAEMNETVKATLVGKVNNQYTDRDATIIANYDVSVRKDNADVAISGSISYEFSLPAGFSLSTDTTYDVLAIKNGNVEGKADNVKIIEGGTVSFLADAAVTFVLVGIEGGSGTETETETETDETTPETEETQPTDETTPAPSDNEKADMKKVLVAVGVAVLGIAAISTAVLVAVKANKKRK